MILNGANLLRAAPIADMSDRKERYLGYSHGLSESGYDCRTAQEIRFSSDNRFVLGHTIERFTMPDHLCGVVMTKSTLARQGVMHFPTTLEPGWSGHLTTEFGYFGNGEVIIPAGVGVIQVLFHLVSDPVSYNGKYQSQPNRPVAAVMEKG